MERIVLDTMNDLHSAYAGACCSMAHGELRWSDFQRSKTKAVSKDAVYSKGPMKNHKTDQPWAAIKTGFNGKDWGTAWLEVWKRNNMPDGDFVLLEPKKERNGFGSKY